MSTLQTPAPPKKKGRKILFIGLGVLAVVVIAALVSRPASSTASADTATPVTATATVTAPPKTVTVTAPPVTVTAPPPAPVTVTVTAQPNAATADPNGPKKDGKYLVGSQIASGTWQCDKPGSFPFWTIHDQSDEIVNNGLDSIAIITDEGYTADLDGCSSTWVKVG